MAAGLPALLGLTLVRNGDYPRHLPLSGPSAAGFICRKKCPGCRTGYSLLPNDVVPLHSYGRELICQRLQASLAGEPEKSQSFYEVHGLIPDDKPTAPGLKATSWSDRVNEEPPRPSPQLFAHWRRKWVNRSHCWLQQLLLACIFAGADLKSKFAQNLVDFLECPESMRALPFAIGLISTLQDVDVGSAFPGAVFLLGCNPSHKICRATGRPPPHYGGDLEFR